MINRAEVELIVCVGELVISESKRWIAFQRLLEQADGIEEFFSRTEYSAVNEIASPQIKIVGSKIAGGFLFNGRFFLRGES